MPRWGPFGHSGHPLCPRARLSDTLPPWRSLSLEPSAPVIKSGQRTGYKELMGALLETPVTDLHEVRHAFDDAEGVPGPAADLGLMRLRARSISFTAPLYR